MSATVNSTAERHVLGAFLQDLECVKRFLPALSTDDFFEAENKAIFTAMQDLFFAKKAIDVATVGEILLRKQSKYGAAQLLQMFREVPSTANASAYYDMVKESAARRKLEAMGRVLMGNANDGLLEVSGIVDNVRHELRSMAQGKDKWLTAKDLSSRTFDYLELSSKGNIQCVKSGLSDLDWLIGGFYPGELTIVGARPAVGKSAFALSILLNAARKGVRGALISREMSPEQIGARMVSNQGEVDGMKLRKGNLNPDDWVSITDALGMLGRMPFHTSYSIRTIEDLWIEAQNLYDQHNISLLIVDYLQLMKTNKKTASRVEEIEYISGSLKDIALDLNIPVIALAQVRRSGSRAAVMPVMDELKGSGAIEQDADSIILLHRPESMSDLSISPADIATFKRLEMIGGQGIVISVVKQRQGNTGIIGVAFDPSHMTYTCIQH